MNYKYCVLTVSDKASSGKRDDVSGITIISMMKDFPSELVKYEIVPDEPAIIKEKLIEYTDSLNVHIILTTGGTGLSPRDNTPEATKEVIEKEVPGIPEAMRYYGLQKTNRAMLSRSVCGIRKKTLIINLPASTRGVTESLEAILPALEHGLEMIMEMEH